MENRKTRKPEREITNFEDIVGLLERCDTIRLGISGGEYPYVVPVSFGYEIKDGKIIVYIHGAKEGLKYDLLSSNNKVCVEADIFHRYTGFGCGASLDYESIIGFGSATIADTYDSKKGLELLMKHAGREGFSAVGKDEIASTVVFKITLSSVSGKRRITN